VALTRYHSYLGQARLGERRESLLLKDALFAAQIPFWMLQALNAIDVLTQSDTMSSEAIVEQLEEIRDYPKLAANMAQHYDQYRLETMARPSIASPPLSDGTVNADNNQISILNKTISNLFGKDEDRLRLTLRNEVDLLSNVVHLSHGQAALDQQSFHLYAKWMKLLAQLSVAIIDTEQSSNINIKTDIQQTESQRLTLSSIVQLATPRLEQILNNIDDNMTIDDMKQALADNPSNLFGLPLTIDHHHIVLNIDKLINTPFDGTPTVQELTSRSLPVPISSNHWATMLGLLLSARLFDMGLAPYLFIGMGILALIADTIWSNRNQLIDYFNQPTKPIRRYRIRRSMMNAA